VRNNIPHNDDTRIWSDLNNGDPSGEITHLRHADRADGPDGRFADEIDLKLNLGYYVSIQKADLEPSRSLSRSIRFKC
jgi:hypothetical protein